MSGLRTLFAALILAACFATPIRAGDGIVWTFAGCTGRLSAQMEYQWLISDPASDITEARRKVMIALLEATMSQEDARSILAHRIDAKHAQSRLLTRAHFNRDAEDAAWAQRRAETEIATCAALLLS